VLRGIYLYLTMIFADWKGWMAGGLSVGLAVVAATFEPSAVVARSLFWTAAVVALLAVTFRAWWREHLEHAKALHRLERRLELCSGTSRVLNRYRLRVCNLSEATVRYGALLEQITPSIDWPLPARLEITGSQPPRLEGEIAGGGEGLVELLMYSPHQPTMRFAVGEDYPHCPVMDYSLLVCVFPTGPDGGLPARRRFRVKLDRNGDAIVTDEGEPVA
jgi:hypothetical protein